MWKASSTPRPPPRVSRTSPSLPTMLPHGSDTTASTDPPGGEPAGPNDSHRVARCDGNEDEFIARRRHTNRREQRGHAAERQVRARRGDVQASGARGRRWTRDQRPNHQRSCSKEDHGCGSDRDEYLPSSGHRSILISSAPPVEISLAAFSVRESHLERSRQRAVRDAAPEATSRLYQWFSSDGLPRAS
jgi:hypothetical protein